MSQLPLSRSLTYSLAALALLMASPSLALKKGDPAPPIEAKNQDGMVVKISELKGKPVVLYFYPKDDTPGCTKQACSLRDHYAAFQKMGVVLLGVSRQNAESHKAFKAKFRLPFDLLTDEDGSLAKAFGISTYPVVGYHKRQTVVIGADSTVLAFFENVDPETHTAEVMKVLTERPTK